MAINMIASGSQINLRSILNSKLESGVLQTELNLSTAAASTGQAARYDEFIIEHNADGTHKDGTIDNAAISATAAIAATKLAIHKMYNKTVTPVSSATANTNGSAVDLTPVGYTMIVPEAMDVTFGGTFGTETVTVTITATFNDTTTKTATVSALAAGVVSLTRSQVMSLFSDGLYITKLSVASKSTIASTATTTSVTHCGFYL